MRSFPRSLARSGPRVFGDGTFRGGTQAAPRQRAAKGARAERLRLLHERGARFWIRSFSPTRASTSRKSPAAYEAARKYPATLDRLHCFCECQESTQFKHKTLLTCFTDEHAAGCGICIKEALIAAELKGRGASDAEIETLVEAVFKTDGHAPRTATTRQAPVRTR